jgi:hypothetical protein
LRSCKVYDEKQGHEENDFHRRQQIVVSTNETTAMNDGRDKDERKTLSGERVTQVIDGERRSSLRMSE